LHDPEGLSFKRSKWPRSQQEIFKFILYSDDCPNPDEILANIIKRGGNVSFDPEMKYDKMDGFRGLPAVRMIDNSYILLCKSLLDRKPFIKEGLCKTLFYAARYGSVPFCKLLVHAGTDVNWFSDGRAGPS
jgi:hypothetical protein